MPAHNKCPLCGSGSITVIYECTDFLVSGEKFPLSLCSSCSFIFTNNYPAEKDSAGYYQSDDYISHSDTSSGMMNKLYHIARDLMLAAKFRMLRKESGLKSASVLDIGSGTGYFLFYVSKKNWECLGIEISREARDYALSKNNLKLMPPEAIDDIKAESIDIITMWHTLEHFYHPEDYFASACKILKKDGLLVIALPNHRSYDAKKYRDLWAAWDVPRHLWHFNPETLQLLAARHHYKLRKIKRLPLDAFYISSLSEKHKNSSLPLLRGLIRGSISFLVSLFDIKKTSSLIYFFRKEELKQGPDQ
ncbi:MAG: class I SAM-dependent methyltransferase [Bacteroidales bacterium]|nr:class I SAM-dependent methyltransferase [Bacteroidales bacterium]